MRRKQRWAGAAAPGHSFERPPQGTRSLFATSATTWHPDMHVYCLPTCGGSTCRLTRSPLAAMWAASSGRGSSWHTQCTSSGRRRLTSARVANAQSKPFKLSPGLPTNSTEGRRRCCWPEGRPLLATLAQLLRPLPPPGAAPPSQACGPSRLQPSAPPPLKLCLCSSADALPAPAWGPCSTLVGATSAGAWGPGQNRWQSTPLCMSREERQNSLCMTAWAPSAHAAWGGGNGAALGAGGKQRRRRQGGCGTGGTTHHGSKGGPLSRGRT